MTVTWTEGFDMYNGAGVNTGLLGRWLSVTTFNGGAALSMTTGRFSGQAFRLTNATSTGGTISSLVKGVVAPSGTPTSGSCGFAIRTSNFPSSMGRILEFCNAGGTEQCGVGINSVGTVFVYQGAGGSTYGSSSIGLIVANTWYYIEVEFTISGSTGSMNVYLNGSSILSVSSQNTLGAGSGGVNIVQLCSHFPTVVSGGANQLDFDDMYFTSTSTRLGERRVETLRPASDSSVQWTPSSGGNNFSRVNEATVDGDTSYVSTSTVGFRDLYGVTPLSTTPTVIDAVNVVSFSEKTDATTRAIYHSVQSSGTDSDGTQINLAASYTRLDRLILTDPNTSTAWTASGVNNLLIGPKVAV